MERFIFSLFLFLATFQYQLINLKTVYKSYTSLFKALFFLIILLNLVLAGDLESSTVRVINRVNNSTDEIKTLDRMRGVYVSVKDVSRILSKRKPYINSDRLKIVVYLGNNRLKISGNSSFILVDERVYQIPNFAVWDNEDIYVQAEALFNLIKETTMPGIDYDTRRMVFCLLYTSPSPRDRG